MIMKNRLSKIIRRLKRYLHLRKYTYGHTYNPDGSKRTRARLNKKTKRAEFILWRAGEQGHKKSFWHNTGIGWEESFKPDPSKSTAKFKRAKP